MSGGRTEPRASLPRRWRRRVRRWRRHTPAGEIVATAVGLGAVVVVVVAGVLFLLLR